MSVHSSVINSTFVVSAPFISGFTRKINVVNCRTMEDVTNACIGAVKTWLTSENLTDLIHVTHSYKFHIHSETLENILRGNCTFYLCICNQS